MILHYVKKVLRHTLILENRQRLGLPRSNKCNDTFFGTRHVLDLMHVTCIYSNTCLVPKRVWILPKVGINTIIISGQVGSQALQYSG